MTGTNKDRMKSIVGYWYLSVIRIALSCIYCWQIMEQWGKKHRRLVEQRDLFGEGLTKRIDRPRESVAYRRGAPIAGTLMREQKQGPHRREMEIKRKTQMCSML
jgi:hypothetical protein